MTGFLRQDNDTNWYFIPAKEVTLFDKLINRACNTPVGDYEWYDINEEIIDKFTQYMIDSPFELKLKQVA